ncbi:MAG: hypothetical protein ACRDR6_11945 [Pseudonocardiaceae bacterium]
MSQEFTSSILFTAEKSRDVESDLLHRYIDTLALSPADYFRMRDCDELARFYIASAMACNGVTDWLTEEEYQAVGELAFTMYDGVTFYKHRTEGEIANLYAYCGQDLEFRIEAYQRARAALWEMETTWGGTVRGRCVINLSKQMSMIHISMRRYRFVEDGLRLGNPETSAVVADARNGVKLWYRNDADPGQQVSAERYADVLVEALERPVENLSPQCIRSAIYGATATKNSVA